MSLTRFDSLRSWLLGSERALVTVLLGATVLAVCNEGRAEESHAARLFREGRALLVEGRFAEACARLQQSQALEPRLGTQLNVGFCLERLGKLRAAWQSFQAAASVARRQGDAERERFARSRVEALAPRVPRLGVRVAASPGAEPPAIWLDGALLSVTGERDEQALEPGEHVLVARTGDEEYWRTTVTLRESERTAITVPAPPARSASGVSSSQRGSDDPPLAAGHFVYELGAFVAYMDVDSSEVTRAESAAGLEVSDEGQTFSCSTSPCAYDFYGSSSGFVVGVAGFVGYAMTPEIDLGLRALIGPRAGGGALIALGPSLSLSLAERYRVSPTVFFGSASYSDEGNAALGTADRIYDIPVRVRSSLGFAIGLGTELGFVLTESALGSVVLQATPLFLYGPNGVGWTLPLGAAFRWN